ncbi:MAG TPA: dihydroorotate dehydrogenase electron transfer subunit [Clostridiaceae bacterium]|nr:dihydroorotate dehydrogenase electron transfer subunit [Clostridiaceae bacterium]
MSRHIKGKIISVEKVVPDIYKMTVESPYISQNAKPGQFINIRCSEGLDMILRRPISIAGADKLKNTFDIYYQIRGTGTKCLSRKKAGEEVDIIGPVGNSFDIFNEYTNIAVVGGGIGIFPLYFLLKEKTDGMKTAFLGFRDKEHIVLEDEFNEAADKLILTTDDGSAGRKGLVTQMLEEDLKLNKYDIIYTCGPLPMMKKVVQLADMYNIKCQVSMEQRMGCGIGACLVCACKIKLNNESQDWVYGHLCKDGPVFWSNQVVLEDFEGEN